MAKHNNHKSPYPIQRIDEDLLALITKMKTGERPTPTEETKLTTFIIWKRLYESLMRKVAEAETQMKEYLDNKPTPTSESLYPDMRLSLIVDERDVTNNEFDIDEIKKKVNTLTKPELLDLLVNNLSRIAINDLRRYFGETLFKQITTKEIRKELRTECFDEGKWKKFSTATKFWKRTQGLLDW